MVGVAQLVSAPDCGSGGQGFESLYPPAYSTSDRSGLVWSFFYHHSFIFGPSPSGKAQDFDSCIRGFEPRRPSFTGIQEATVSDLCGYGGIGRRARFRFWWETVQVQVLLPARGFCVGIPDFAGIPVSLFRGVSWSTFFGRFYCFLDLRCSLWERTGL